MLRILMGTVCVLSSACSLAEPVYQESVYQESLYKEPGHALLIEQKNNAEFALKQASELSQQSLLKTIVEQEKNQLTRVPNNLQGLKINVPLDQALINDDGAIAKAITAGLQLENNKNHQLPIAITPIVLVSLSMPDNQLRALIEEAYQVGAMIAVRGLIDDDFPKTLTKLKQLAVDKEAGLVIDPTLFRRFSVSNVPTFVLPTEPLAVCSHSGCPTPSHVKATGSATIQYFLDLIVRTGNADEKKQAQVWLSKYET